jgi:hypothetical protein
VYAAYLKFDLPEYTINHLLFKNFPNCRIRVGKVSGMFPFVFKVSNISVLDYINIKNVQVALKLRTLKAMVTVDSVSTAFPLHSPQRFSVQDVVEFAKKNYRHVSFLHNIHSLILNRIAHNGKSYSLAFIGKTFTLQTDAASLQLDFLTPSFCCCQYLLQLPESQYEGVVNISHDDVSVQATVTKHKYLQNSSANLCMAYADISRAFRFFSVFFDTHAENQMEKIGNFSTKLLGDFTVGSISGKIRFAPIHKMHLQTEAKLQKKKQKLYDCQKSSEKLLVDSQDVSPATNCMGGLAQQIGQDLLDEYNDRIEIELSSNIPSKISESKVNPKHSEPNVLTSSLGTCVVWHDSSALRFDFLGQFSCRGAYSNHQIVIDRIEGKLGARHISSKDINIDLSEKRVSPTVIHIDSYKIETLPFCFADTATCANWKMPKLCIENSKINFGDFNFNGTIGKDLCTINFDLSPCKDVRTSIKRFGITAKGMVTIAPKSVVIESFQINSGDNSTVRASLGMHANKFTDLLGAFRQIFSGQPIVDTNIQLQGHVDGNFALQPIAVFLNAGDLIAGVVTLNLDILGTLSSPRLAGTFTLSNGLYEHFSNGVVLKNVTLRAEGEGSSLKIIQARMDDGTFIGPRQEIEVSPPKRCAGGSGSLTLFTPDHVLFPQLLLNLRCNFLQVAYSNLLKARASGDLKMCGSVTGTSNGPMITGDIKVDEMLITTSTDITSTKTESWVVCEKGRPITVAPEKPSSLRSERFSMMVTIGGNVIVQSSDIRCFITGTVVAKGTITNAYLVGEMVANPVLSSKYNLFGKIMVVESGVVRYDEESTNNPYLNVVLATKINQYKISATLAGRLSNINIVFKSNPPTSSEEILSLLLFGQGLSQISADQNHHVKTFSSHMLQGNPLAIIDSLRKNLKIDSFEFVDSQNISSGETVRSVRFGKNFKKAKVFIDHDSENKSKMILRYDVTPEIGIDANISTNKGSSSIGIQFEKKY